MFIFIQTLQLVTLRKIFIFNVLVIIYYANAEENEVVGGIRSSSKGRGKEACAR